jgi:hypothetical protein
MLGVAIPISAFEFPFPVLQAMTPDDLIQAATSIHDLGIPLSAE